jgi:hypothetical protein
MYSIASDEAISARIVARLPRATKTVALAMTITDRP